MSVTFGDLVAAKLLVQLRWRGAREVARELVALDGDPLAPPYLDGLAASQVLDPERVQKVARYVARYDTVRRDALVAGVLERSRRLSLDEVVAWKGHLEAEGYRRPLTTLLLEAGRIDATTEQQLRSEQERMIGRENERLLSRYRRERYEGVDRPLTRDPKARIETGVFTIRKLFRSPESQRLSLQSGEAPAARPASRRGPGSSVTDDPGTFRYQPGMLDSGPRDALGERTMVQDLGRTAPFDSAAAHAALAEGLASPEPVPTPTPVPARIGDFEVERTLGAGGMGVVVLARRRGDPAPVAIKIARSRGSEVAERFRREVLATSLVRHENVVRQLGAGFLPDGTPYMVLEYLEGRELREIMKERTRIPPREALSIVVQLLAALGAAHAAGVVHRDVKPENLLVVESRGQIVSKLMDFGLARIDKDTAAITEEVFHTVATNVVSGSPPYLAPEQILGEPIDGRTDLYAVGVVLFEMLTGTQPFASPTYAGVVRAHVSKQPPRLAERTGDEIFPAALEGLVAALLAKKADARPADARAVLELIEHQVLPALTPSTETLAATQMDEASSPAAAARSDARGITRILARLFLRKPDAKT